MILQINNGEYQEMLKDPFRLEKELQTFFEENMTLLTGYRFLISEFIVDRYRLDSVAFNDERQCFVVVEYKRGQNESLVDQGYAYLNKILSRKADFVLMYNEQTGSSKRIKDFDWSQTSIAFVSSRFTTYQKDATSFNSAAFELYEVQRFENGIISVELIGKESNEASVVSKNTFKSHVEPTIASEVIKELKVYDLDYLLQRRKSNTFVKDTYLELKERILQFDPELVETFLKHYVTYKCDPKHNIVSMWLNGNWIEVVLNAKLGEITDPYGLTYDISNRQWPAAQYAVKVDPSTNLDEVMDLIQKTYRASKYTK